MNRTIILCSYNRAIQEQTRQSIAALINLGAAFIKQTGSADVTLARNLALSAGCRALRQLNLEASYASPSPHPDRDTLLMVDDDMLFDAHHAQRLVDHTRVFGRAASAMYATMGGSLAGTRITIGAPDDEQTLAALQACGVHPQRWVTGLGLLAIPARLVLELEARSETFQFPDRNDPRGVSDNNAFTTSGPSGGDWWSEDYTLTRNLGGVHLLPMAIGHLKTIPIYPDAETVRRIKEGDLLGNGEPPEIELRPRGADEKEESIANRE
jgi:hypothetical protein